MSTEDQDHRFKEQTADDGAQSKMNRRNIFW